MVDVAPWRPLEYDPRRVDLDRVVSPPFDVITPPELERLRKSAPHNIVHLTIPQPTPEGDGLHEAGERLDTWLRDGILREAGPSCLFAYECAFLHRGQPRRMRGVLGLVRVDPEYQQVVPHEATFPKPTEMRRLLLSATATDLEPIQLVVGGDSAETALWAYLDGAQRAADVTLAGTDGAVHRYWRITDPAIMDTVTRGLRGKKAYIADGHHRYAAAVAYADARRTQTPRAPRPAPWDWKLSLLVNINDPGLLILPTHRVLLRWPGPPPKDLEKVWSEFFRVEKIALDPTRPVDALARRVESATKPTLGAWWGGAQGLLLEAIDPIVSEDHAPAKSLAYRSLDVALLQHVALDATLGVREERWADDVHYTRSPEEAIRLVRDEKAVMVLVHRPTRMAQVRAMADARERMPPKSTYFLPKTLSGVAMNRIGRPDMGPPRPKYTS